MVEFYTGVQRREVKVGKKKGLLSFGTKLDQLIWRNLLPDESTVKVMSTTTKLNLELLDEDSYQCLINLKRINDVRFINKFLETANSRLPRFGYYIGCVQTKNQRKKKIFDSYPWLFAHLFYIFDFIFHRLLPKFTYSKKFYFWATKGQNRVLTFTETLGRLISCGFEIADHQEIDGLTWFVARKTESPKYDLEPTYGPLVRLRRVGMNGKYIYVHKLRTMHPYSEYIQEYVYLKNDLKEGGKLDSDYRITSWGRIFRKLWIDELPMLWNLLKGEIKLVGVRPLSDHYFRLYPEDLQKIRIRSRPGLVPPFYADMPKTFDEIVTSERKYLDAYSKEPFNTDVKYFFRIMYNILFKKARSG